METIKNKTIDELNTDFAEYIIESNKKITILNATIKAKEDKIHEYVSMILKRDCIIEEHERTIKQLASQIVELESAATA